MAFEYVCSYYGVPACVGRRVTVNGRPGTITEDRGHHIGVNFDDQKPGVIASCHPTWEVQYLGIGRVRPMTKGQQRYKRFLEYGDGFANFMDYVCWDSAAERSWNGGRGGSIN